MVVKYSACEKQYVPVVGKAVVFDCERGFFLYDASGGGRKINQGEITGYSLRRPHGTAACRKCVDDHGAKSTVTTEAERQEFP